jgi:excisionase family DNA binding protein
MATRGRADPVSPRAPASASGAASAASAGPRLFTAQEVARFCEVDLKTVHHWAERGKIPHFRTQGRHLRFRRNDLVRFLRAHGYPLPEALTRTKPVVAVGPVEPAEVELAKKLASRFTTRRFATGLGAFAHVLSDQPDAVVVSSTDPTLGGARSIAALREEAPWILVAIVCADDSAAEARAAGAEVVVASADLSRLGQELARALGL